MGIIKALPSDVPVNIFTADPRLFERHQLPEHCQITVINSLFEASSDWVAPYLTQQNTPEIFHNVPLGWGQITDSIAQITQWFSQVKPAVFVVDVSAELALLARICSVPCVHVRQHGDRSDIAHSSAYQSCVGLLAPYDESLEHVSTPEWIRKKTCYMGGEMREDTSNTQADSMVFDSAKKVITVISGKGGSGIAYAPLTLAARCLPDYQFHVLGEVRREWHETDAPNLICHGWVNNPCDFIKHSDLVIASCGNTTVHNILSFKKPYICIPEWRYFDEQRFKAEALAAAGVAVYLPNFPGSKAQWLIAIEQAFAIDPDRQAALIDTQADSRAASYLMGLHEQISEQTNQRSMNQPKAAQI